MAADTGFFGKGIQRDWSSKKTPIGKVVTNLFDDNRYRNIEGIADLKGLSAKDLQIKINDYFNKKYDGTNSTNPFGRIQEDNKWGTQSNFGLAMYLNELLTNLKMKNNITNNFILPIPQPSVDSETGLFSPIGPTTITPTIPTLPTYNFNRAGTRDIMRLSNLNPYEYTGAQRKALRKYLNGESLDTSLLTGDLAKFIRTSKTGGKMTQKFQQGGAAQDPQQQIIQLVQAAMGGDQKATAQIQQIMLAAEQGDQQAGQLAEIIMQVMNQMQGSAPQGQPAPTVARNGAKLNYIKKLKGECPEGYEMTFFKAGGKVCKKCQRKIEQDKCGNKVKKGACGKKMACGSKFHKEGGVMEQVLSEIFAKGGAMNRNKHTAFGEERGANVVSTNHAGRWGGRRAFNERGTHNLNPHDKPNKFSAFGDEGKKKPTNVGLVGHHATGKTGRMQNRQKAGTTYKGTAFGGEKQKRFHKGVSGNMRSGLRKNNYPKGQWGKGGIGKI